MADLLWDDVKCFFDPELPGALPDLCTPDASAQDWRAVLDLVVASAWRRRCSEGEAVLPGAADPEGGGRAVPPG
ncbi:hypothetical protein GCM10027162_76200 [Streptomyces incanus]